MSAAVVPALSQDSAAVRPASGVRVPLWFGFGGGANFLSFSTDGSLRCLGDPACPQYSGGTAFAPAFGASLDWRFSAGFGLLLRAAYNPAGIVLAAEDDRARTLDASGSVVPLVRRHTLELTTRAIHFDILGNLPLGDFRIFAGGTAGLLLSPVWESASEILSPANVTFGNNRRDTLFMPETAIPDAETFQPGVTAGLGYDLRLSQKLILAPELHATLPLAAIVGSGDLRKFSAGLTLSLRFGSGVSKPEDKQFRRIFDTIILQNPAIVGNRFSFGKTVVQTEVAETDERRVITETTTRRDTMTIGAKPIEPPKPPKPVAPTAALTLSGIGENGGQTPLTEFAVRGRYVTEGFPLLPMVFFDNNASAPAPRYHLLAAADGFTEDKLPPQSLEQHREILNIIGRRMRDNPNARITLRGTADPTTENADCRLAEARARAVKDYLASVWGVDERRISLARQGRKCEPESPTTSPVEAGFAENRRVEIESDDEEILFAPVLREKYIELTGVEPEKFEANPDGSVAEKLRSWELSARYGKVEIGAAKGLSAPVLQVFPIAPDAARAMHAGQAETVDLTFVLTDANGLSDRVEREIPIRRDTLRQAIDRLSLMHFQVLKDKLNRTAKTAIKRFITDLDSEATVSVVGYTDNLGDPDLNQRLSAGRADEVTSYIKRQAQSVNIIRSEGVAATKFPPGIHSHDLPEARILSRTVQIEIIRNRR